MFIISRYVIKEHIGPFFFGFFVITLIFVLNIVFRDLSRILSKGLALSVVLEFLFLNLAWIVALAVPMAVLIASLMAFGRLSADLEITALKASGVSLYRTITPAFIMSIIVAAGLIWFNNRVLPEFNHRARLLGTDIARKRPTLNLEPGVLFQGIPKYHIMVTDIEELDGYSRVENIMIDDRTDANARKLVLARDAEIEVNEQAGNMRITLHDGEIHELETATLHEYRRVRFPKHVVSIPVPQMALQRSHSNYRGDREKSAQMMMDEIDKNRTAIKERKAKIADLIFGKLRTGDTLAVSGEAKLEKIRSVEDEMGDKLMTTLHQAIGDSISSEHILSVLAKNRGIVSRIRNEHIVIRNFERSSNILLVEVHKKFSIPVACMVFVLIGAPLGIMARQRGMAAGGAMSIGFFLIYWIFLIGGEELADAQHVPPWLAMWAPNILVGLAGVYLVVRAVREYTTINWHRIAGSFRRRLNWAN